ncbi:MAG TPA: periplasmic heavy metal sensor [Polyangiaceae bacterium]
MFGIIFGTLCLVGLVVVIARGRRGFGHGRFHRHGHGYGPRAVLNGMLARLDTAPGQEKVIVAAVEDFMDRARESGRKVRDTRAELASSVRGDRVDEARLGEIFGRHDAAIGDVRTAAVDALRTIHEALDERQRKLFADLIESGGYFGWHHHRHAC